jgi:hypothetical protein
MVLIDWNKTLKKHANSIRFSESIGSQNDFSDLYSDGIAAGLRLPTEISGVSFSPCRQISRKYLKLGKD